MIAFWIILFVGEDNVFVSLSPSVEEENFK